MPYNKAFISANKIATISGVDFSQHAALNLIKSATQKAETKHNNSTTKQLYQ